MPFAGDERRAGARYERSAPLCDLAGTRLKSRRIVVRPVQGAQDARRPEWLGYTRPVAGPVDVDARIAANHRLSDAYNILELDAPEIALRTRPGQFVMVKRALGREPLLRRPFSVFEVLRDAAGAPTGLSLLSKQVGAVTRDLFRAQPGERLRCLGPLGVPFSVVDPPTRAWMVAGGVGLAPFATLAEALHARGVDATLFYGGRSGNDLYRIPFFERLDVRVVLTTEDGTRGESGRVTVPLARELASAAGQPLMLYACGPTPMMRAVAELSARAGQPVQVSLEPVMGCGLGGCYSCVVRVLDGSARFVRSCLEGPVFEGSRVSWADLT